MSPAAAGQSQDPAAGEDLFQFGERAVAAAAHAPGAGAAPLLPMGVVDDTLAGDLAPDELPDEPVGEPFGEEPGRRAALPPVVVPLLLVMAIANLALVALTWKSLGRERPPSAPAAHAEAEAHGPARIPDAAHAQGDERRAEGRERGLVHLPGSRDEAFAALEDAERTLDAGEFVAARRELYGLLTLLDRVELAERPDVEARAGFLIAESYRLQARSLVAAAEEAP